MYTRRAAFAKHAWIAILAILLTVLAPAVNHLLPQASAEEAIELCTSQGVKLLAYDSGQHDNPLSTGTDHCAYCGVHAASHAAIPPSPAVALAMPRHALRPTLFYQSPRLLFAWTVAASRAPPVLA